MRSRRERARPRPQGISFTEIDGGRTFYADYGFTHAAAGGWDNPEFLPIGLWFAPMQSQGDADRWLDLRLNTMFISVNASNTLTLLRDNGLFLVIADDVTTIEATTGAIGSETVGILPVDEPNNVGDISTPIGNIPTAKQDNRFLYVNFLWRFIADESLDGTAADVVLSQEYDTPDTSTRHLSLCSYDSYFFAGGKVPSIGAYDIDQMYGFSVSSTDHPLACHYGDFIDRIREFQENDYPAPILQLIENGGPYTENTQASYYIFPDEMNAAVWAAIIHGARGYYYFNHSFAGPAESQDNFAASYYQSPQAGQPISIYDQAKATNSLALSLARVINSPTVNGYATVSPAAGNFSGFDLMVKMRNGEYYIFAMPRGATDDQDATFTIVDKKARSAQVVNEQRRVSIYNGMFTDNFATRNTVHIYKVGK